MKRKWKSKSKGRSCCVPMCKNYELNNKNLRFYAFPNRSYETERKKLWIARVRREVSWTPTKFTVICSEHFINGIKSNNPTEENYNPTIFPWKPVKKCATVRRERFLNRKKKVEEKVEKKEIIVEDSTEAIDELQFAEENAVSVDEKYTQTDLSEITISDDSKILYCWQDSLKNEASTQTDIYINSFCKQIIKKVEVCVPQEKISRTVAVGPSMDMRNESQWFANIKDSTTMKQLAEIDLVFFNILLKFIKAKSECQPKYYKVMNCEDELLLFLMKMKLGLPFTALSCIFKIGITTARSIFFDVLETLYIKTKTWIFWPLKEAVKGTLPKSFQRHPKCRAIIDCTEFRCETPPKVEQRAQMYSSYKSSYTIKYLVAITPCGYISFISKGYGGRSSDSFITNDSGFINLIEPGDEIMADKGFPQIRSELLKHNSVLIMPPFGFNPQFTREEVINGYNIASVRIHVERCIQRIRIFKVLDFISMKFIPHIDKVVFMACVLANNKEPLIRDKE